MVFLRVHVDVILLTDGDEVEINALKEYMDKVF